MELFEEDLARFHGLPFCIATSSGTSAIHSVLSALDIGPGDEVIAPAHTFVASASPILARGASPVFADVDPNTFCISPDSVRTRLSPRTRAVIAVHLNGHAARVDLIQSMCEDHDIALIEDVAQAPGARINGALAGTVGVAGCFSFNEEKILTTGGEGGAVITADEALCHRVRRIRQHGEGPLEGTPFFASQELGYNYKLTAMQAALGRSQLRRLPDFLSARRANAVRLTELLGQKSGWVGPPYVDPQTEHSYWKYVCRLGPGLMQGGLDAFLKAASARGVPAFRRYPVPLPKQPIFLKGRDVHQCPVAESLTTKVFSLPIHPGLDESHLDFMSSAVSEAAREISEMCTPDFGNGIGEEGS